MVADILCVAQDLTFRANPEKPSLKGSCIALYSTKEVCHVVLSAAFVP